MFEKKNLRKRCKQDRMFEESEARHEDVANKKK